MRTKVGKESGNASKKRGRPINPNSQRNKLNALGEQYKRESLEYQIEDEDGDEEDRDGDEDEDNDESIDLIP